MRATITLSSHPPKSFRTLPGRRLFQSEAKDKKEARHKPGFRMSVGRRPLRCFFLDAFLGSGFFRRFWTTAWALRQSRLNLLDRLGLGDTLNRRDLPRQAIEGRFVQLTLGIGLLRLCFGTVEVANHFGNGDDIA